MCDQSKNHVYQTQQEEIDGSDFQFGSGYIATARRV